MTIRTPAAGAAAERRGSVAAVPTPRWLRHTLTLAATVYLVSLFLQTAAPRWPRAYLPPSLLFFTQATCLFPRAARMAIDYRLEVWDCDAQRFRELDVAGLFPIRPDDKESRFQRVGHFYRQNRSVMRALEAYVIERENLAGPRIGGVRLSSVRTPLPGLGAFVPRWSPPQLLEQPPDRIKPWYYTSLSRREAFCAGKQPEPDRSSGEARHRPAESHPREPFDDDTQDRSEDLP